VAALVGKLASPTLSWVKMAALVAVVLTLPRVGALVYLVKDLMVGLLPPVLALGVVVAGLLEVIAPVLTTVALAVLEHLIPLLVLL
jgi:hypothetical protein